MTLYNLTARLLRLFVISSLMGLPAFALENPDAKPKTGKGKCPPWTTGQGSVHWSFDVGHDLKGETGMIGMARAGAEEGQRLGNMPRLVDEVLKESDERKRKGRIAKVQLTMESANVDPTLTTPLTLAVDKGDYTEVIMETPGGGGGELAWIRQLVTLDSIVDVQAAGGGFIVNVYDIFAKRDALARGKTTKGTYDIPSNHSPTQRAIVMGSVIQQNGSSAYKVDFYFRDNSNGAVRVEKQSFIGQGFSQTKYTYASSVGTWDQAPAPNVLLESETITKIPGIKLYDYSLIRELRTVSTNGSGPVYGTLNLDSRTKEVYRDFTPAGQTSKSSYKRLVSQTEGYDSPQARETTYDWYDEPTNPTIHGRLKQKISPDGNWEYYEYTDSPGASTFQQVKYSSWLTTSGQNFQGLSAESALTARKASARKEVLSIGSDTGYTKVTSFAGATVSTEEFSSIPQSNGSQLKTRTIKNSANLVVRRENWLINSTAGGSAQAGRLAWIENADGTAETFTYTSLGDGYRSVHRVGAGSRTGVVSGTEITTDYSLEGFESVQQTKDISTGLVLEFWTGTGVDAHGRPTRVEYNGNPDDYETFQYACCGLERKRSRDGSVVVYTYDPLKRVYQECNYRFDGDPNPIYTTTSYNGLVTTTTRGGILVEEVTRFLNGAPATIKTPDQNNDGVPEVTTLATSYPSSGGRIETTTYPDGGTEIRTFYAEGALKSVSGSAAPDEEHVYTTHALSGNGVCEQVIKKSEASPTGEWQKIYLDSLGRIFRIETPGDLDGNGTADAKLQQFYHGTLGPLGSRGKLQQVTSPDGKVSTYTYNSSGQLSGLTEQVTAGQSRVTLFAHDVVNDQQIGPARRTIRTINGVTFETQLSSGDGYSQKFGRFDATFSRIHSVASATGDATVTLRRPDGTTDVEVIIGNLLTQKIRKDSAGSQLTSTTYSYDPLHRISSILDSRTGSKVITGYTAAGQILSESDAGTRSTIYGYDSMGRQILLDQPDTQDAAGIVLPNKTYYSYYPTGMRKATWGDQTNPVLFAYDEQNRMSLQRTYRNLALGVEPTLSTAGYDSTIWNYDVFRGFISSKVDAQSKSATFTYTPAGKLKSRTWARSTGAAPLSTTYTYDKEILTYTDYSDGTPDVSVQYDAFGRGTTVTQFNQSQIIYSYDPVTLSIDTETVNYDLDHDGAYEFSRTLDRAPYTLGRDNGWQLKDGSTVENEVSYGYSPTTGRLTTVTGGADTSGLDTFTYGYLPNSNLIQTVTGVAHTVTNTYHNDRNILDFKESKAGTVVISSYDYNVNALGQRTGLTAVGSAFFANRSWEWGYDAIGQVTREDSSVNLNDRSYQYDALGNRKKSATSLSLPTSDNYAADIVNQYSSLIPESQSSSLSLSFDFDGNATSGPLPLVPNSLNTLSWDAENRLTSVTKSGGGTTQYLYDAFGRRIAKGPYPDTKVVVYNGWNPVAEYWKTEISPLTLRRTQVWGLDLSQTLQGAGGVGGLLLQTIHNPGKKLKYYPTYDGNGNVSEYIGTEGDVEAHFEYDAFGRTTMNTDVDNLFGFRFSTKYLDAETGLYYYGYRYYDNMQGRWLSRDPLGESGGINLYSNIGNDLVNHADYLGLCECDKPEVADDAGVKCCPELIGDVELQIEVGVIGHAQLHLPGEGEQVHGFFPPLSGNVLERLGIIPGEGHYDPAGHDYTPGQARKYKACPGSVEKLKKSIEDNKKNTYSVTNIGGESCVGWACNRLEDAGFDAPMAGSAPLAQPKDVAPNFQWNLPW